jgi:putative transposase
VTSPRQILPGGTYLITRRCTQRQFLLRPDDRTNHILSYCLAEALSRYGIELIAWLAMSNHYHIVVFDEYGVLPAFLRHLNLMTAKALNVRWGRWENLWAVEQACVTRLVEDADVLAKSVYTLANPAAGDLVERVADWPGASSWNAHLNGRSAVFERPNGFFREGGPMPERVELKVVAPRRASDPTTRWPLEDWTNQLVAGVRAAEEEANARRIAQGSKILGRRAIRHQSAFETPKSSERKRRLRPSIACRNPERRINELRSLAVFRRQHRLASQALLSGDRVVVFPPGTWALRNLCESQRAPK